MRTRFKALAAIAVASTLALAGCSPSSNGGDTPASGGGGEDKPFKVIAFTSGNQTPVGGWWVKAVQAKADALGWDLTMIPGDFDFQKMNPAVESAIGDGADAIFDGYTDYAAIDSIVTAAKDADIPIFAMDAGTEPTDAFVVDITTNQQGMVDQTLGAIKDALGGSLSGKSVMILGHDPHPGIRMRSGLAMKDLEAAGATIAGGSIKQIQNPASGRTEALKFVQDYLAGGGKLDAVWAGWDDAALGAATAVSEGNSKAVVTGVDALSETIAAIEDGGPMLATIEQPWPSILDSVVEDIETYRASKELPSENFVAVDTTLVTKDNAKDITPSDKLG